MAKGLPIQGKDPNGNAKFVNVDENGNALVKQVGNIASVTINDVDYPTRWVIDDTDPENPVAISMSFPLKETVEFVSSSCRNIGNDSSLRHGLIGLGSSVPS